MKKRFFVLLTSLVMLVTLACPIGVYADNELKSQADFEAACQEVLDSSLNSDGALEFFSAPPSNEDDFKLLLDLHGDWYGGDIGFNNNDYGIEWDASPSKDFKSCTVNMVYYYYDDDGNETVFEKEYNVPIKWNYDASIKAQADEIMKEFPKNKTFFRIDDLALVKQWVDTTAAGDDLELQRWATASANYSEEIKELRQEIRPDGFQIIAEARAADGGVFYGMNYGPTRLMHGDTIYGVRGEVGGETYAVLYVDDSTDGTKEGLKEAVQKRIDDYFGAGVVKVGVKDGGITSNIEAVKQPIYDYIAEIQADPYLDQATKDEEIAIEEQFLAELEAELEEELAKGGKYYFVTQAKEQYGNFCFTATIGENTFDFLVQKTDAKLTKPEFKGKDKHTGVQIRTTSSKLPWDTFMEVEHVKSGTLYEKIVKLLKVSNCLMFDMKLYSDSYGGYITEIDGDKFEVRIPIKGTSLEGKKLAAYYVDEQDRVHTYSVNIEGDDAVFTTDHFSIYTLAEVEDEAGHKMGSESGMLALFLMVAAATGITGGILITRRRVSQEK